MQKFLISNNEQELQDLRNIILGNHTLCIPHVEFGCTYGIVIESNDKLEFILAISEGAEQYLTQIQIDSLVDVITDNFIDESIF